MSNSAQQTRELVSVAITMIDKAVNNELSLSAQFCVGCLLSVKQVLEKVLAVPLRECDIGTAEEQYRRHDEFCDATRNGMSGYHCEDAPRCVFCFSKWAQRPYSSDEAKGGKV